MYFVMTKRSGYVLFCLTPSEHGAVGLTDKQMVHVLVRDGGDADWQVIAEWPASEFSHTDLMVAWHHRPEPDDPRALLSVVPASLRSRLGA